MVSTPIRVQSKRNTVTDIGLAKFGATQIGNGFRPNGRNLKSITNVRRKILYLYSKETSRIENANRMYSHLRYEGKCAFCGDAFKCSSSKAKYCSDRCRNDAYIKRRKHYKAMEKKKICSICGKEFTAKKKDGIYCSNACKQKAYRQRKVLLN